MEHYRSEKSFTPIICVHLRQSVADTVLDTDCDSKGVAVNTGFTDYTYPIIFVFAGLASFF
ncbi:MAG: hypothetical protein C4B59_02845 [Candidatus Methanogaster sp.]|uniref:Uncharacterized protein n=1 Tax=Candidatus Methanogaster sp. TaxID=3386292 RepID=A0AC61L5Y7_9EURY|nr:MAG: hypothetical protein C4B59_02845 [ANME-2 cluster archaeon]